MIFGYARVSTREQHLDQQIAALEKYGCDMILTEKVSGQSAKRPVLDSLLETLRDNEDTLVFWRLDRIGRSTVHLIQTIEALDKRGIKLVALRENLDTKTASGKLMYRIMGVLAEFELDLIRERTEAGMKSAKKRGKHAGRRYSQSPILMRKCIEMLLSGATPEQVQERFSKAPSAPTLYRWKKLYNDGDAGLLAHLAKADKPQGNSDA